MADNTPVGKMPPTKKVHGAQHSAAGADKTDAGKKPPTKQVDDYHAQHDLGEPHTTSPDRSQQLKNLYAAPSQKNKK